MYCVLDITSCFLKIKIKKQIYFLLNIFKSHLVRFYKQGSSLVWWNKRLFRFAFVPVFGSSFYPDVLIHFFKGLHCWWLLLLKILQKSCNHELSEIIYHGLTFRYEFWEYIWLFKNFHCYFSVFISLFPYFFCDIFSVGCFGKHNLIL